MMYPNISCRQSMLSWSSGQMSFKKSSHVGHCAVGSYANGKQFNVKNPRLCGSNNFCSVWNKPFSSDTNLDGSGLSLPYPSNHTGGLVCATLGKWVMASTASKIPDTVAGPGLNAIICIFLSYFLHLSKKLYN